MAHDMKKMHHVAISLTLLVALAACRPDTTGDSPPADAAGDPPPALTERCTNPAAGYSIAYPAGWHTNSGEVMSPCSLFDPEPITVPPASEIPIDIAIIIAVQPVPIATLAGDMPGRRDISRDTVTISGRRAIRIEGETTDMGLHDSGIRLYEVFVELGDSTLAGSTYGVGAPSFGEKRRILDAMMPTLETGDARAYAQDRIVGLLALPVVFGNGACDRFQPVDVPLHAAPASDDTVAVIRVVQPWTQHAGGGCEGLRVGIVRASRDTAATLPVQEFAYEEPGAIVVERRGRWFRIRTDEGTAWLETQLVETFHPIEELLRSGLTYVTDASDGRLYGSPSAGAAASPDPAAPWSVVRVTDLRRSGDDIWAQVEVFAESPCESASPPEVSARGWMPVHATSGEPAIWFFSRGC